MVHRPAETRVTVRESAPERVQVDSVVDAYKSASPLEDVSAALSVKVPVPRVRLLNALKVIVWDALLTVTVLVVVAVS